MTCVIPCVLVGRVNVDTHGHKYTQVRMLLCVTTCSHIVSIQYVVVQDWIPKRTLDNARCRCPRRRAGNAWGRALGSDCASMGMPRLAPACAGFGVRERFHSESNPCCRRMLSCTRPDVDVDCPDVSMRDVATLRGPVYRRSTLPTLALRFVRRRWRIRSFGPTWSTMELRSWRRASKDAEAYCVRELEGLARCPPSPDSRRTLAFADFAGLPLLASRPRYNVAPRRSGIVFASSLSAATLALVWSQSRCSVVCPIEDAACSRRCGDNPSVPTNNVEPWPLVALSHQRCQTCAEDVTDLRRGGDRMYGRARRPRHRHRDPPE